MAVSRNSVGSGVRTYERNVAVGSLMDFESVATGEKLKANLSIRKCMITVEVEIYIGHAIIR